MARAKTPKSAEPKDGRLSYADISEIMQVETASIINDYVRQYVGIATETPTPGSGVFINQDRILKTQTWQEIAWYDLYAELEKDPHVSAILQTRKLAVSRLPWHIVPHDADDPRQAEQAAFVQHALDEMENFNQDIYELMDAVAKGFSVSEIVWDESKAGAVLPVRIMNRPQRRFQFDATTRALKLRNIQNPFYGDPLPEMKFLCHRSGMVWENPFGDAIDQKLYWMWLFKKTVLSYWMKKNEVEMACVPLVKHPASASKELKNEALSIAENIRIGAYGRIPDNFEVVWAQSNAAASSVEQYRMFVEYCNSEMTRCVLGQTLTTEASGASGNGSRALGSVHNDVRTDIRDFDAKAIEGTLNSSIIRWIIDINYGYQEYYPKFRFVPDETQDVLGDSAVLKNLVDAGFRPTAAWVAERFAVELDETPAQNNQTLNTSN